MSASAVGLPKPPAIPVMKTFAKFVLLALRSFEPTAPAEAFLSRLPEFLA